MNRSKQKEKRRQEILNVGLDLFIRKGFALRFLQFPILPAVPFLKFDFSDAFILICAYALGPVAGIIAGVMKEVIYGIAFTGSAFVGEIANIIILIPFILIPSIMYKKHKGIKSVLFWLAVACVVRTIWSIPVNLLLNFPAFMGFNWELGMSMFYTHSNRRRQRLAVLITWLT